MQPFKLGLILQLKEGVSKALLHFGGFLRTLREESFVFRNQKPSVLVTSITGEWGEQKLDHSGGECKSSFSHPPISSLETPSSLSSLSGPLASGWAH